MTWAQLRELLIQATVDSSSAREESYTHLSLGYRRIATDPRVNVPELQSVDTAVTVTAALDSVAISAIDFSLFAIANVFNKTDGIPMYPEPAGMMGRDRYLTTTGKPATGNVTHYMRDGSLLYVRNTPSVDTTLIVRVMRQVPDITSADLNSSPLTPPQYDMAIVHAAAASYFSPHPKEGIVQDGAQKTIMLASKHHEEVERVLGTVRQPAEIEDKPRYETMRLAGYRIRPRMSRR